MNCFYHQDITAVGLCKACSKGLCPDCAADLGHGIACRGKHEQRAEEIEYLISKNSDATRAAKNSYRTGVLFLGFIGVVFTGYGLFGRTEMSWLSILIGGGFLMSALVAFIQSRGVWRKK